MTSKNKGFHIMQQFIAMFLVLCMFLNTACNENTFSKNRSEVSSSNSKPNENKNAVAKTATPTPTALPLNAIQSNAQYSQLRAALVAAMQAGNLKIKDEDGDDASIESFEAAPDKHYLLFADKDKNLALRTAVSPSYSKSKLLNGIKIGVQLYNVESADNFSKDNLSSPIVDETASLGITGNNKEALKKLMDAIEKSTDLAVNNKSTLEKISAFLFPTAYGDSDTLKWVAIGVSIAAGVSILWALAGGSKWWGPVLLGIATAVLWVMYFEEKDDEEKEAAAQAAQNANNSTVLGSCVLILPEYFSSLNHHVCYEYPKHATVTEASVKLRCTGYNKSWLSGKPCRRENIYHECVYRDTRFAADYDVKSFILEPTLPAVSLQLCNPMVIGL